MGTTRKTITVTEQQNSKIKAQNLNEEFTDESECIRDSICHEQSGQADVEAIRAELIKAEQSGEPRSFNGEIFKQEMIAKHGIK